MTNVFLLALLICHLLGDFYFQSRDLADRKKEGLSDNLLHCLLYAFPFAVLLVLFAVFSHSRDSLIFVAAILFALVATHAIVDIIKWMLFKIGWLQQSYKVVAFIVDQLIHFVIIVAVGLSFGDFLQEVPWGTGEEYLIWWRIAFFVLAVGKPVNVAFKIVFERFAVDTEVDNEGTKTVLTEEGAGALIGTFERLIMGAFAIMGQFAAMGLVMAAKTLSRYDRISKNPRFAEYYLIGTLCSVLTMIILHLLTFGLPI